MGASHQRPHLDETCPTQHPRFLLCCHLGSLSAATSPGAEKAILSRDRQRPLEAEGSGFGSMENGAKSLGLGGGNQDQELPPEPASFSQVALLILDRAGGTFGGQPSCLQLRALPGLPSSQPCLPLGPIPFGWLIFCLGQREANLGCYTSYTETVLGPLDLTEV